ncbi:HAMP domain-containing histidine kinase [bacterium]|nr:HAMP domain-containing histidine kinase [bacterium]
MYRIGKLQTVSGSKLRVPCPLAPLLEVVRLTGQRKVSTKSWAALITCHPSLLIFCIDRFLQQRQHPPASVKQLSIWAKEDLAEALSHSKVIKPIKGKLGYASRSILKPWQSAASVCEHNGVLFQFLKQQLAKGNSASEIKRWLKNSASEILRDAKLVVAKERLPLKRPSSGRSTSGLSPELSPKLLRSLLRTAVKTARCESEFKNRLQVEKLAALKQLAYGASHEINNPLANIATGSQALMQSEPDSDRRLRLANIYQQSMAAHEMICDLMLFAHPPTPVMETVDLRSLVSEIVNRSEKQGRKVVATFGPGVTEAKLDRTQIIVAIEALLRNAFEAIGQMEGDDHQPKVSIRIDIVSAFYSNGHGNVDGDWLRFFIVDNGPGFDNQQSRHMFDPFYSGREAGRGLGFGLSKVYRIVKLHNGEILADRDDRVGETTFLFRLPLK